VCENSYKVDRILSVDMKREDFYPLNIFVNNQIEKAWVEQMKVDQIKQRILEFMAKDKRYEEYNVVLGQTPAYYLQGKKNTIFAFRYGQIAIFIYKAKPFDIPKIKAIENFVKSDLENGGAKMSSQIVTICEKDCQEDSNRELIQSIKDWVGCYFNKHFIQETPKEDFETKFIKRLKMFIIAESKDLYWNIFYSKRLEYQLTDCNFDYPETREICFELDFDCFKDLKYKPRLLIFQRRTKPEFIFGSLQSKWREIIVFLGMLLAFIVFTVCPSTEEAAEDMRAGVMRNICRHRSEVLMSVGAVIACLVVFKMVTSKNRKNLKQKFKQQ
jgi:hypothetical protein